LHQDHEHHEQRVKNVNAEQDVDQKVHRDGQYRQVAHFVNGGLAARAEEGGANGTRVIPSRADGTPTTGGALTSQALYRFRVTLRAYVELRALHVA
jgi:hypothetical protein